jgi:hypothetical protein
LPNDDEIEGNELREKQEKDSTLTGLDQAANGPRVGPDGPTLGCMIFILSG